MMGLEKMRERSWEKKETKELAGLEENWGERKLDNGKKGDGKDRVPG